MEIVRQKNVATYIMFPIVDADGDPVVSAAGLDTQLDFWNDGAAPDGFAAATNEATENGAGTTGVYYLSLTQAEMNYDYIYVRVYSSTAGAKVQHILIRTIVGDPLLLATTTAGGTVETGVQTVLETNNLDHLCKTATAAADMTTEVSDNTIISRILANGDTSVFNPATDGLQPIRDENSPIMADWTNAGRLDAILDVIAADTTTDIPAAISAAHTTTDGKADQIIAATITNAAGVDIAADIIAVKAETATIVADTNELQTDDIPTLIGGLNNISTAQVNAEVVDVLATDTYTEPGQGAPGVTISLATKIGYLYKAWRNKKDNDGSTRNLYNDNTTTVDQKSTVSEAAGTVTVGEVASGP